MATAQWKKAALMRGTNANVSSLSNLNHSSWVI